MSNGIEVSAYSPVNQRRRKARLCAVLLVCLCPLSFLIGAHAQATLSPQLSTFQIPPEAFRGEFLLLIGAGLSPDGQQVTAAYFTRATLSPTAKIVLNLRIWKVGAQEPIAITQMSASQEAELDFASGRPFRRPEGFVQYCDHGSGIMVSDPHGTLYYLNPQTLEVLHATATNMSMGGTRTDPLLTSERVFCAANSPRAVLAAYGGLGNGRYGNGLVRVYDLTSGALLQEWDMTKHPYCFGDAAISPSGNQIAVSRVPENGWRRAKDVQNLELFEVSSGKLTLQIKTGHLPGRIVFAGESRIATDDTVVPQPFYPHPKIKLWDTSNGKLISEFSDPKVGARRFVGASSDGSVILGYIPKEVLRTAHFSPFWNESLEQRFRLWDVATGKMIATSPLIFPRLNLTVNGRNAELDPSLELSANGEAVLVFWKSRWNEIYPICVFSEVPVGTPSTTH
jgi:WD40 repeat protein